jgi:hypothetical protein
MTEATTLCTRCTRVPADGTCCSSHNKQLCHGCYRRTHFVEVCSVECAKCKREGLPQLLAGGSR